MKPIYYLLFLILCLSLLTACDNKYPTANIPDEPLAKPLEIIIEPKKVAMTSSWAAGIKEDGTLWTWGSGQGNLASELGVDPTPLPVKGINDAVAISAGTQHMLLLRKDGSVWGWGDNGDGQIDPNSDDYFVLEPRRIEGLAEIVDMSAEFDSSVFVNKNGEVFYLGSNQWKILKNINEEKILSPTKILGLKDIVRVDANSGYILALDTNGRLFTTACKDTFLEVFQSEQGKICQVPFDKKVVDFAHGITDFALLDDGAVWAWGDLEIKAQETNNNKLLLPRRVKGLSQIVNISNFSANTHNGDVYIWGEYLVGKKPSNGSMMSIHHPILIKQNTQVAQYARSPYISALVTKTGEVWFWEGNRYGQRGTGQVVETFYKDYVLTPEKSLFTTY